MQIAFFYLQSSEGKGEAGGEGMVVVEVRLDVSEAGQQRTQMS